MNTKGTGCGTALAYVSILVIALLAIGWFVQWLMWEYEKSGVWG